MLRVAVLCVVLPFGALPSFESDVGRVGRVHYEPRSFLGYACEDDCQRHKAGLRWAERHAVNDAQQCTVLPRPEAEGCAAFVDQGRDARAAGETWALENEIAHQSDCEGAGERFLDGCIRQLPQPINTY